MTKDERAIRALAEKWMAASKMGDLPAILELMTDDVLFLTPRPGSLRQARVPCSFRVTQGVKIEGRASIQEIEVAGDWAWLRNHIDLKVSPAGSSVQRRSGETLTILRKGQDGCGRLYRDVNTH